MVRPAGLEPAASRLEVSRSIQMSYGRTITPLTSLHRAEKCVMKYYEKNIKITFVE